MIAWKALVAGISERRDAVERLPKRVVDLIRQREIESERLIGWSQLVVVGIFAVLYLISPRPADAPPSMLAPVPLALAIYTGFTIVRLRLAYRCHMPGWLLAVSIFADTALLLGLIWSFHSQYAQLPAFSLKVPTFIYVVVFIALRTLRFDFRYVLAAGLAAAAGWAVLVILAIRFSPDGTVTRNFIDYAQGGGILIGAELDKILAILIATAVLSLAVMRAQNVLVTAVREEAAGREIGRFLSRGVAEAIAASDTVIEAGHAAERDAAVLMLDIRGFTRFSTTVAPEQVVQMLTGFHARVLPLIRAHGGVVDKFMGDGVMATFGAVSPSSTAAADAVRSLMAVIQDTEEWRAALSEVAVATPLEVNGAVAFGRVVFAALGHEDRLEYTVIGDAANLAAKLEKHNKIERTRALVSAQTFDIAVAQGYIPNREADRRSQAHVAGVAEPIDLVVLSTGR